MTSRPTQLPDEVDGDDDDVIDLTDEYNPLQIQVKLGAAYGSVEEGVSCKTFLLGNFVIY